MVQELLFYIFATLTVISGVSVISARNSITSALSLIATLGAVAALFALLDAHFIATIQILVYAGAIMVLFVFVIMLLNLEPEAVQGLRLTPGKALAAGVAAAGTVLLLWKFVGVKGAFPAIGEDYGTMEAVAEALFIQYLIPFEAVSLLLTAAVVGAVVIGKREL